MRNVVIHEIGHNFGLADLYGGSYRYDGIATPNYPIEIVVDILP
jgi:hypothetical protein